MVHRRSVLKVGAAGLAGAFLRIPAPALGAGPINATAPLYRAVFDERYVESVSFADELRHSGVATASAGSDIAALWYGDLHVQPGQRTSIAGLTDRATLFCLEELARSRGLRVVYRIDHLIDERGHVEHDPAGPIAIVVAAGKLISKPEFGRDMAVLAKRFDAMQREHHNTAATKRTGPFSPEGKVALVSWVIA